MADLSRLDTPVTQQDRITHNRDTVLPARRDTDAPKLEVNATLKSAARGSGAAELQKILSSMGGAADSFQDYANAQYDKNEQDNGQRGSMDALAGQKDEALAAKSKAYREAFSTEDARSTVNKANLEVSQGLDQLLNDPSKPVDQHDVDQWLTEHFKGYVYGDDGKVRDYGSPQATKAVAQGLADIRAKALAHATKTITDQEHDRFTSTLLDNGKAEFAQGKLNFEDLLSRRLPGMDLNETRQYLVEGLSEDAMERKDPAALEQLLNSKRADGQSSFTPEQLKAIRVQRTQLQDRMDADQAKADRKRWDEASDGFLDRLNGIGSYPTKAEIINARKRGDLDSEHTNALLNHIDADISHRDALAAHADAMTQKAWDQRAQVTGNAIVSKFVRGEMSYGQAQDAILRTDVDGGFGMGDVRRKNISETRTELQQIESMRRDRLETPNGKAAQNDIKLAEDALTGQVRTRLRGPAAASAENYVKQLVAKGTRDWASGAYAGQDPAEGAQNVIRYLHNNMRAKYPRLFIKRGQAPAN